jgi:hypothetical protein
MKENREAEFVYHFEGDKKSGVTMKAKMPISLMMTMIELLVEWHSWTMNTHNVVVLQLRRSVSAYFVFEMTGVTSSVYKIRLLSRVLV